MAIDDNRFAASPFGVPADPWEGDWWLRDSDQERPGRPDEVSDRVARAVLAAAENRRRPHQLDGDDPLWRQTVAEVLENLLAGTLALLWGLGWQPDDLHRLARKRSKWAGRVMRDAMLGELGQYARALVDQRFWDQLDALEAERWWPEDSGHLRARTGHRDWDQIVIGAVEAAAVLTHLPKIEQHWPPPGQAQPRSERAGPAVDDRILARVRGLLAKAESTTFEAEAESFTAAAQALMARHSIDMALLAAAGQRAPGDAPQALRIGLDAPYEQAKAMLLGAVADASSCRVVWAKEWSFCTVVGFPAELVAVQNLFTSLLVQATSSLRREGSRVRWDGTSRTRSFRVSFLMSFAQRISERLRTATDEETAKASAEAKAAGRDLLPILASRRQETEQAFAAMFPATTEVASAMISDDEGWAAGRAAADLARIAAGEELKR
ncbi:DUF2786 domain-containing protein [Granulicoccus sp. GXG6511]|uniref:DUF2786 domain-containing protein n=1 Tax=Granulicoccus sp. GXG6511 TaxID=3381351 RepID=UPI003D7DCD64